MLGNKFEDHLNACATLRAGVASVRVYLHDNAEIVPVCLMTLGSDLERYQQWATQNKDSVVKILEEKGVAAAP